MCNRDKLSHGNHSGLLDLLGDVLLLKCIKDLDVESLVNPLEFWQGSSINGHELHYELPSYTEGLARNTGLVV